jgi:predicted site-specific integrase-resolvase
MKTEDLMKASDIAEMFDISTRTVHRWCEAGYIHPTKIGKLKYFKKSEIDNLINGSSNEPK